MRTSREPVAAEQRRWWQDKTMTYVTWWAMWFVLVFWLTLIIVALAIIIPVGQTISNHVDRTNCAKYAKATGLETRFAYYGFWHNECILIGPNGVELPDNRTINNVGN